MTPFYGHRQQHPESTDAHQPTTPLVFSFLYNNNNITININTHSNVLLNADHVNTADFMGVLAIRPRLVMG